MANPGPLISTFWTDNNSLSNSLRLDGVICLVDAYNFLHYLDEEVIEFEIKQQISYADRILINKIDLLKDNDENEDEKNNNNDNDNENNLNNTNIKYEKNEKINLKLKKINKEIKKINSLALIEYSTYSKVNLDFILSINSYNEENSQNYDELSKFSACFPCNPRYNSGISHKLGEVKSISLILDGEFDLKSLNVMLDRLLYNNGREQINHTNQENLLLSNDNNEKLDDNNIKKLKREEKLAMIPTNLIVYRVKGLLHIKDERLKLLQGVHEIFDITDCPPSTTDPTNGKNLIVVIGCNLFEKDIEGLFKSCLV